MKSKSYRLDRFIRAHSRYSLADTRTLIAQKRIMLDGCAAESIQQKINQFTKVELDGRCLQSNTAIYIMLNKPKGVVCATKDVEHRTVIDLIKHPLKHTLHIVGRLDFNTTGLVLLTNDGRWSKKISLPESKLKKEYKVKLKSALTKAYITAFTQGIYFAYEDITTAPATLNIESNHTATLRITEGKYHQVKRMFGHFQNEVLELHRSAVGNIKLDESLKYGEYRELSAEEITGIAN